MENIVPNTNDSLYNSSDLLFNSYYDFLYDDSNLLFNTYHNYPTFELNGSSHNSSDPVFELYDSSHGSSSLPFDMYNEIQVEDEMMDEVIHPDDETIFRYDGNVDEEEGNNNSEHEEEEENEIKLFEEMEFETWELAESYLDEYAKQQGFCFRKKRRVPDPTDNTITRRRTYECSHAQIHEAQKVVLAENRRDRDSEMIGCPWHINIAFPKLASGVRINSIIGEHNHDMNPLITEIAPKFRKLTDEMLEKVKFWTIHGKMGISTQYNLLVASFPGKVINKKI
jgi:FAR1 DNA-binding domain